MKKQRLILLGLVVLMSGRYALAAGCDPLSQTAEIDALNTGTILVQAGQPAGSMLARKVVNGSGKTLATCGDQRWLRQFRIVNAAKVPGFAHTYQTGVQGVGMRIRSVFGWVDAIDTARVEDGDDTLKSRAPYIISFIKTGPIEPGNFAVRDVLEERVSSSSRSWEPVRKLRITGGGVSQASCQVLTPSVIVPLGELSPDRLQRTGEVGQDHNFEIAVNCHAGTPLNITFDRLSGRRKSESGQIQGVADSEPGEGMATGVGVQLLHDKTPVSFDQSIALGVVEEEGVTRIPLGARYYRKEGLLGAGRVNAVVGFTLTYQ